MELLHFANHGKEEKATLAVINFARALFVGLIIFEILNFLKILELNTQFTWLGLVLTSIFVLTLLEITAHKYKKKKGHYLHWTIWVIAVTALSLDAAGDFLHLYGKIGWWDQVVHYSVNAIVAFTLFAVINAFWIDKFRYSLLLKEGRLKLALFLAATSTVSLGALYEVEEYLEDVFFDTNRLGPGADTANDLAMNILGALTTVAIVTIYYLITHKRKIID
ncbi:MAG: hypothetical protein MUC28_01505 [Planctomycetes bacterium]|jgi:uncharacterized membrane protein YjdF|nr:hypothetical protein [Planctomycetota bacterium]